MDRSAHRDVIRELRPHKRALSGEEQVYGSSLLQLKKSHKIKCDLLEMST